MKALELKGKFRSGVIVRTRGICELECDGFSWWEYLQRHLTGDWGDMSAEDKKENEFSLNNGFRLFSAYDTDQGKIWIITENDRSATTILLPSEY